MLRLELLNLQNEISKYEDLADKEQGKRKEIEENRNNLNVELVNLESKIRTLVDENQGLRNELDRVNDNLNKRIEDEVSKESLATDQQTMTQLMEKIQELEVTIETTEVKYLEKIS